MEKKKAWCIYIIKNIVDGKVYIGQTSNIKVRISSHKSELKRNKHRNEYLQNAVNKFSIDNFVFEVIEDCDETNIDNRERYWMDFYDSCNRSKGYNLVYGGNSNKHHSEETKLKIGNSLIGKRIGWEMDEETKNKISISKTGNPNSYPSEETLIKLSLARIGRKHSEETKNKISIAHNKLTEIQVEEIRKKFATGNYYYRELAEEYMVSDRTISNVVNFRFSHNK